MSVPVRVHHAVRLDTKTSRPYVNDEGVEVSAHGLFRWACACGDAGLVWYSQAVIAQRLGDRHLMDAGRVS